MKTPFQKLLCVCFSSTLFFLMASVNGQNAGISFNGAAPNISAAFDIDVTALAGVKKGLLIPRVTAAQRAAMSPLPAAAQGLLVYQTDGAQGFYYNTSLTTTPAWALLANSIGLRWDLLQNASSNLMLNNGANKTTMNFDGLTTGAAFTMFSTTNTSGSLLSLESSSNDGPGGGLTSRLLNINRTGANNNSGNISTGIYSNVVNTGTNSTNYAGFFSASGGTNNHGVHAQTDANTGIAIYGVNTSTGANDQFGIKAEKTGVNAAARGFALMGLSSGTAHFNYGGYFEANDADENFGVFSLVNSKKAYGVLGRNTSTAPGEQYGIYGQKFGNTVTGNSYAIKGIAAGTASNNFGGHFSATGATINYGVWAETDADNSEAIHGVNTSAGDGNLVGIKGLKTGDGLFNSRGYGVMGMATGKGYFNYGGYFESGDADLNYGVYSTVTSNLGYAVIGNNSSSAIFDQHGLYGSKTGDIIGANGYAVRGVAQGQATINYGGHFLASGAFKNYAVWATTDGDGQAIHGENSSNGANDLVGVMGKKTGSNIDGIGKAVTGIASGTCWQNYGGYFESTGTELNYGVLGKAISTAQENYGGSFSAGLGTSKNIGVWSEVSGVSGQAVHGVNNSISATPQYGVYGEKSGNISPSNGYAVYGIATGTANFNIGGYFSAGGATNNYALYVPPNGGHVGVGTFTASANSILALKDGHLQSQQTNPPTIATFPAAGSGSTAFINLLSSDIAGAFSITNGTSGWTAGAQATITFNKAFSTNPRIIVTATNSNAANRNIYVTAGTSSFTISFAAAAGGNVPSTFNYIVIEN